MKKLLLAISFLLISVTSFAISPTASSVNMTPDNCKLAVCPHCGGKKGIMQLASGNTIGAVLWSDAKQVAPMLPQVSPVQKCPMCGHYYLLNNVQFEEGDTYSFEEGWLSFDEAVEAFHELNNQENLELLTIIIAWAFNDMLRADSEPSQEQYETFKIIVSNNLKQSIFMEDALLRAELHREIEEFDECLSVLSKYRPENDFIASIKKGIIKRAKNQDNKVFVIN